MANLAPSQVHFMDMQLAVTRQLRWYLNSISVSNGKITMSRCALTLWDQQDQYRLTVSGIDFEEVLWTFPCPDLLACFPIFRMHPRRDSKCSLSESLASDRLKTVLHALL